MPIASNVREQLANSSWIRRMFELGIALKRERGDENVFDLSLGNPVVEPPAQFFDELRRLADSPVPGAHRYMPNAGYPRRGRQSPTRSPPRRVWRTARSM